MLHLKTIKPKKTETVNVPGLITGNIEYEIKSGESKVQWTGPRITPEVWHPVLAWFKSVFDRHRSECQVRLYVNTETGVWAAWAYPQEARTGMSAREIDNPEAATQRAQFSEADGWQYLGTVHHHCSGSAFQSHTDYQNERTQDGLHITIGKLDERQYDMHARFYLSGTEFAPDMSVFWDIGEQCRNIMPTDCFDRIARHQMTSPAPAGTVIPAEWDTNLIDTTPVARVIHYPNHAGFQNGSANGTPQSKSGSASVNRGLDLTAGPEYERKKKALQAVKDDCRLAGMTPAAIDACFQELAESEFCTFLLGAARSYGLASFSIVEEWEWERDCREQALAASAGLGEGWNRAMDGL